MLQGELVKLYAFLLIRNEDGGIKKKGVVSEKVYGGAWEAKERGGGGGKRKWGGPKVFH